MNINEDEGRLYRKTKEKLLEMLTNSIGEVVNTQGNLGNEVLLAQHNNPNLRLDQNVLDVLVAQGWKPPSKYNRQHNKTYQYKKPEYQKTKPTFTKYRQREFNPKGEDGKYLKCHSCDSVRHLIKDCPDSHENRKGKNKKTIKKEVYYTVVGESDSESQDESEPSSDGEIKRHMSQTQHKSTTRIVMFTQDKNELNRFTTECLNHGALDTCCTS
jgi:hypothetical protein